MENEQQQCQRCYERDLKTAEVSKSTLNDLLYLKLRNEISKREALTACANNDLAMYGEWQCDWAEGFSQTDERIAKILSEKEA